jgi:hypothetical protein
MSNGYNPIVRQGDRGHGTYPRSRVRRASLASIVIGAVSRCFYVMILTVANVQDVHELIPLVDPILPIRGKRGRPRRRPDDDGEVS